MDLDAYFERIGYQGSPRVDEATLAELHAAHLTAIPYENLDLQVGQEKHLDEARFEERLVAARRGGWCYEMNGLLSAALRQIGFRVDRLGGSIARDLQGDKGAGHHMVLAVHLDRPYVADVGLGDGPLHPFPMEVRRWTEAGFTYAVERTEDGWWRVSNHAHGLAPSFDFQETARTLSWYRAPCRFLQTEPNSPFLQLALIFRRDATRVRAVRDLTLIDVEGTKKIEDAIATRDHYARVLADMVGIDDEALVSTLWDRVSARVARRAAETAAAKEAE